MQEPEPATILIADDEPQVRSLLSVVLSAEGYVILEAVDGVQAIQILEEQLLSSGRPCLLILDLMMPPVDGFAVLDYVQSRRLSVPVIVQSASPIHLPTARIAGAQAVLAKPFDLSELLSVVARFSQAPAQGNYVV
jgi:CheY-like chemotaxis protein